MVPRTGKESSIKFVMVTRVNTTAWRQACSGTRCQGSRKTVRCRGQSGLVGCADGSSQQGVNAPESCLECVGDTFLNVTAAVGSGSLRVSGSS